MSPTHKGQYTITQWTWSWFQKSQSWNCSPELDLDPGKSSLLMKMKLEKLYPWAQKSHKQVLC